MNCTELCANCGDPTTGDPITGDSIYYVNCEFGPLCPACADENCPECGESVDEEVDLSTPCSEASLRRGCTCMSRFPDSASLEPPEPIIDRNCPLHGRPQ